MTWRAWKQACEKQRKDTLLSCISGGFEVNGMNEDQEIVQCFE